MVQITVELTRTEKSQEKGFLEAALKMFGAEIQESEYFPEQEMFLFPKTYDDQERLNPSYIIKSDQSLTDIYTLIKCNGWDVKKALPHTKEFTGETQ